MNRRTAVGSWARQKDAEIEGSSQHPSPQMGLETDSCPKQEGCR